jgi:large subunit ribosomal protein L25
MFSLMVHAKPADIPGAIEVDISELGIGDAIRVGDLKLPAGVTTDVDPEETVVAGATTRMAAETEAEEEAAAEAAEDAEAGGGGDGDEGAGGADEG